MFRRARDEVWCRATWETDSPSFPVVSPGRATRFSRSLRCVPRWLRRSSVGAGPCPSALTPLRTYAEARTKSAFSNVNSRVLLERRFPPVDIRACAAASIDAPGAGCWAQ